uniref:Uncharacterized protein n=1 Tax=Salix viminalis TaxID=40686 RepID=A0A6N2KDK4_SALVM
MFGYLQLACVLLLCLMCLSVIFLVTYFVGGGLLLLNVFGFRPFRCDDALVRHCILVNPPVEFLVQAWKTESRSVSPWNQSEVENGHEISLQDMS